MGRTIVITSGKGGVGKSTVTANIGIFLAMNEKRVVLVDADIGLNNLDVIMMIESKIVYDIEDISSGRCRVKQALIQDSSLATLYTLPSTKSIYNCRIATEAFNNIIQQLSNEFDYVLIDCPAGIEEGFHRAVSGAKEAIVVTTPHISAVRDADKVISLLLSYNIKNIGLVVNRLKGKLILEGSMIDALDIAKLLKVPLRGAIPEDDCLNIDSQVRRTKSTNTSIQLAYQLLVEHIDGKHTKVFDCSSDYRGFFKKIKRFLGG